MIRHDLADGKILFRPLPSGGIKGCPKIATQAASEALAAIVDLHEGLPAVITGLPLCRFRPAWPERLLVDYLDDLSWMQKQLDETLEAGSVAFRREAGSAVKRVITLIYDPTKETKDQFEVRLAAAVAATGEPAENVDVIVHEIISWNPNTDQHGHA